MICCTTSVLEHARIVEKLFEWWCVHEGRLVELEGTGGGLTHALFG